MAIPRTDWNKDVFAAYDQGDSADDGTVVNHIKSCMLSEDYDEYGAPSGVERVMFYMILASLQRTRRYNVRAEAGGYVPGFDTSLLTPDTTPEVVLKSMLAVVAYIQEKAQDPVLHALLRCARDTHCICMAVRVASYHGLSLHYSGDTSLQTSPLVSLWVACRTGNTTIRRALMVCEHLVKETGGTFTNAITLHTTRMICSLAWKALHAESDRDAVIRVARYVCINILATACPKVFTWAHDNADTTDTVNKCYDMLAENPLQRNPPRTVSFLFTLASWE
jgi:hypothetical protein